MSASGEPSNKRPRTSNSSATSKHLIGYRSAWATEYPWLEPVEADGCVTGMTCVLCKRFRAKNKYNQSTVWTETPCISLRKDSVRRHSKCEQHKLAEQLEATRLASQRDGGIPQLLQSQLALQRKAVKGAMQYLYWLVLSEIPHTGNYGSLIDAVQFMGCDYFKHLHIGDNANYKSQRIIQEFLSVLADQIKLSQLNDLLRKSYYSLMIDETTDIAVLNEMVIYCRYVSNNSVKTAFLKIAELFNGTAECIEKTLLEYLHENNIPLAKMVGFGSDGASVMLGRHNGVSTRLKRHQPILLNIHCLCHKLALAAGESGKDVAFIFQKFKPTLTQLFYFYQNSSVRMSGLQAIEDLLNTPHLKVKRAADTRWLSHEGACQTLYS